EALTKRESDLGRGALGHASPELVALPVDDVHGASLGVDGLRAEIHESAQVRLAVLLYGEVPELDEDERDLVVEHGLVVTRNGRATDGDVRRRRGLGSGHRSE